MMWYKLNGIDVFLEKKTATLLAELNATVEENPGITFLPREPTFTIEDVKAWSLDGSRKLDGLYKFL
jgi:hypothetical protein